MLSVVEKLLDIRVTQNRALGMKENNIFEDARVLDDVQDLMHLVRDQQLTRKKAGNVQPPEEGWSGPVEGKPPACGPV